MTTLRERLNNLSPAYQAFLDFSPMTLGMEAPSFVPKGWVYRDLPPLEQEQVDTFLEVVGASEIKWLSLARSPRGVRGQMFVSPDGIARLKAYLETAN